MSCYHRLGPTSLLEKTFTADLETSRFASPIKLAYQLLCYPILFILPEPAIALEPPLSTSQAPFSSASTWRSDIFLERSTSFRSSLMTNHKKCRTSATSVDLEMGERKKDKERSSDVDDDRVFSGKCGSDICVESLPCSSTPSWTHSGTSESRLDVLENEDNDESSAPQRISQWVLYCQSHSAYTRKP